MPWEIKGESGQTLSSTLRSFPALRITAAQLQFQSLAEDSFTWTAATDNAAGAGTIIPDVGQVVELFLDGDRKFRGHCMRPVITPGAVTVKVVGPWWWLNQIYLTSNQTDASGNVAERVKYVLATGDLKTRIAALIDRAIANGAPMLRSTIAEMWDTPQITLSNMTIARALAQMLARVPDAVAWFDYSTTGEDPKLKISRRNGGDAMPDLGYTLGSDVVEKSLRLAPREDLLVKRVELNFMDRNPASGKPRFQTQGSGTTATGKLQIVTLAGPEVVDFLPIDDLQSATVQTGASGVIPTSHILLNDSVIAALRKKYGKNNVPGAVADSITYWTGSSTKKTKNTKRFPGLSVLRDNGGVISSFSGYYLVLSKDLPAWAIAQWEGIKVTVSGTWLAAWRDSEQGPGTPWSSAFKELRTGAFAVASNSWENETPYGGTMPPGGWGFADYRVDWAARQFTVPGVLLKAVSGLPQNPPWTSATKVYKAWDYEFVQPPAGMASALRVAQDWLPWEGQVPVVKDAVNGSNLLGRAINLSGTVAECATMRALQKTLTYDLLRQRVVHTLGAPARIDLGTAMGRVPSSPQDVIVEI